MLWSTLGLCLLLVTPGLAQEGPAPWEQATPAGHFLKAESVALDRLPMPPTEGSLAALADLEAVLQAQEWRTPEQLAWAKYIESDTVWKFAPVIGPWFRAENLPKTAHFFWQLTVDTHALSEHIKGRWKRPRPYKVDPRIVPCVFAPTNDSYPSGHTLQAFVRAGVLAELFPGLRDALWDRAHQAGWGRVLGGVHYPTDIVGGRLLAEEMLLRLKSNPDFQRAVEVSRLEIGVWLLKKTG
ncbi:MAG: phosphatase PAP2 family protein [Holophaga sp.]|nr:phosphatase PAP2 family protein [Holophaga sp.]